MRQLVFRRSVTEFPFEGRRLFRAHVWGSKGYSSKTFATIGEATTWVPR